MRFYFFFFSRTGVLWTSVRYYLAILKLVYVAILSKLPIIAFKLAVIHYRMYFFLLFYPPFTIHTNRHIYSINYLPNKFSFLHCCHHISFLCTHVPIFSFFKFFLFFSSYILYAQYGKIGNLHKTGRPEYPILTVRRLLIRVWLHMYRIT